MMKHVDCNDVMNTWLLNTWFSTHVFGRDFPAVWVRAGHEHDPGGVDEPLDVLVPGQILVAEMVGQMEEQLPAKDFVAVHVRDVFHLGFH